MPVFFIVDFDYVSQSAFPLNRRLSIYTDKYKFVIRTTRTNRRNRHDSKEEKAKLPPGVIWDPTTKPEQTTSACTQSAWASLNRQ